MASHVWNLFRPSEEIAGELIIKGLMLKASFSRILAVQSFFSGIPKWN